MRRRPRRARVADRTETPPRGRITEIANASNNRCSWSLLLGAGVAWPKPEEQVEKTQLAMKSNLTSAIVLSDMARDEKPYDQAAVDKALAELDDVAKSFPSLFPESIKGLKLEGRLLHVAEDMDGAGGFRGVLCDLCESRR